MPENRFGADLLPYPVGSIVDYHGTHAHGRYVIAAHETPREGVPDPEVNYPDGVAYVIWREGIERRWGNRNHMVSQVRRQSITPISSDSRDQAAQQIPSGGGI